MRTRYRVTSSIVLGTLLLLILSAFLPQAKRVAASTPDGVATWDPCTMIVEYGSMHNLMGLITFGALITFTAQGLRNRFGPRWLAIIGLLGLILVVEDAAWQGGCYRPASQVRSGIWFGSVALLFLHHSLQPRRQNEAWSQGSHRVKLACQGVLGVFVSLLGAWFAFVQLMHIIAGSKPDLAATLTSTVQRNISLPAYVLLPFVTIIAAYQIATRSKTANFG
jgi:hypothetical protein